MWAQLSLYSISPCFTEPPPPPHPPGEVRTARALDYTGVSPVLQLVVVARDAGSPPRTAMAALHVTVTRVNRHPPRFLDLPEGGFR